LSSDTCHEARKINVYRYIDTSILTGEKIINKHSCLRSVVLVRIDTWWLSVKHLTLVLIGDLTSLSSDFCCVTGDLSFTQVRDILHKAVIKFV